MNKSGSRPTRRQKQIMQKKRLNPDNWWVVKNLQDSLHIKNKYNGKIKVIDLVI